MEKVIGIKSVDFKITALGHGVVNWNGPTALSSNGKNLDNHSLPKLRGYTNLTGAISDKGFKYKKDVTDVDFKKNPLYISQNCIRHHLFKNQAFDVHYANKNKMENLTKILASETGLIRGYVVPASQNKRTSPLLIEDFVDQLGNGNYEQLSNSSSVEEVTNVDGTTSYKRGENSIFSKTTFGDTQYTSYGSISIEQLQFISLDKKFDREAMQIKEGQGEVVAKEVQDFIQSLNTELKPIAVFHANYVRGGTIFEEGENGILLNNDAIQALVEYTLAIVSELSIRQAKSYMYVDNITVDYNESNKMMRIKPDEGSISETPEGEYASYFYAK
ncbi:type I-Fv CRISPR-associated protein Cas7fv [Colwellia sp. C1TZA3]|uniref:type I-Fv CRISPR-associated protein Cas7fv n=1 Tax=Colwellia sp. C1TZA3 TaxID=2508879 RepID=UPI0011B9FBB4|nr:type I-Fv CRISPR-associated protein Cas7fv [Colwellia sp. C1TZA3]TWX73145.1 hypothetical protein ESZ39_05075 [Colwellia sp. C1TZA3]